MSSRSEVEDEMSRVFEHGEMFNSTDEKLKEYLSHLCSGSVPNEMVRHREINRCQVINTIMTFRLYDELRRESRRVQRSNKILTFIVIGLTGVSIVLSFLMWEQNKKTSAAFNETNRNIEKLVYFEGKIVETMEKVLYEKKQ